VKLFAKICDNNNSPNNQRDSTSNLEDLSDEYESCWAKHHGSDSNSSSEPKGSNMSPSTNQYSNEVANLEMIHVLVFSALRFSRGILCQCSVITLRNETNCLFKFMLIVSSLPTFRAVDKRVKSQSKLTIFCNLYTYMKKQ